MEVRDSVYGLINYDSLEEKLLDHQVVQRLRGIKQLALCSLVYPGAVHTRFEHSLGVTHLAGRIAKCLGLSSEEEQLVRLAGLLHDVGHGPFSHVSEEILERVACPAARKAPWNSIGLVSSRGDHGRNHPAALEGLHSRWFYPSP